MIRAISKRDVIGAAEFWKKNPGYHGFRDSTKYDVIIEGQAYPPKAIIAISHEKAKLGEMLPSSFMGAKDGKWHRMLKELGFSIVPKGVFLTEASEIGEAASISSDIDDLNDSCSDSPTMKATLIMARLGQGVFRKDLLALWDNRCAVTGCDILQVLRASHAKPWRSANNQERLDPNNGVPLVANLDALFDAGLIGFDKSGEMLVSKELHDETLLNGVPTSLSRKPTIEQAYYLQEHLDLIFKKK